MTKTAACRRLLPPGCLACLVLVGVGRAAPPAGDGSSPPAALTLHGALQYALANNPSLAAQRSQLGVAAARVVIAETYPFNPVFENRVQYASGPPAAGVLNVVPVEHLLLWEVEVRHQGRYRRQAAAAGLTRTE